MDTERGCTAATGAGTAAAHAGTDAAASAADAHESVTDAATPTAAATDAANAAANAAKSAGRKVKKWFSDVRLKENVKFAGKVADINTYTYNYVWDKETVQKGAMAQELLDTKYADAVEMHKSGYYMVDYSKLPHGVH